MTSKVASVSFSASNSAPSKSLPFILIPSSSSNKTALPPAPSLSSPSAFSFDFADASPSGINLLPKPNLELILYPETG